jgi:hypothetical protein
MNRRAKAVIGAARDYLKGKTSRQTYNRRIGQIWRRSASVDSRAGRIPDSKLGEMLAQADDARDGQGASDGQTSSG